MAEDIIMITITIMSGADDGEQLLFGSLPITLGRHPDDDVYLPYDERCSRHHARITRNKESFFIEDTGPEGHGSVNGTYIGDSKIDGKTQISSGQTILLGTVWVKFEVEQYCDGNTEDTR